MAYKTTELQDGREDIILIQGGVHLLTITQELYRPMKFSYAEAKTPMGIAQILMSVAVALAKNENKPSEVQVGKNENNPSDSPSVVS